MRALIASWVMAWSCGAFAATPAIEVRPGPASDPWWLRSTLHLRATVVHGIPIRRLHPDWCAAEAFGPEFFGADLLGKTPMDGLAFVLEGRFEAGAKAQTAFVGAYRRCSGEQGLFMAIVEPHKDRARMRFLVEVPDPPSAFAALAREPDGTLAVWWCAACDNGHRIEFNREGRSFFVAGPATRR